MISGKYIARIFKSKKIALSVSGALLAVVGGLALLMWAIGHGKELDKRERAWVSELAPYFQGYEEEERAKDLTTYAIAVGDVEPDGDLDRLAAGPEGVKYLENTPEGIVDRGIIAEVPGGGNLTGYSVVLGDLIGDKSLDCVVAGMWGIKLIEYNQGTWTDRGVIADVPGGNSLSGFGVALGDRDGDGDLDIYTASADGMRVILNNYPRELPEQ